ncbi:hypothetical protein U1Q18_026744 [Sarracenia purpurea var. burkii]
MLEATTHLREMDEVEEDHPSGPNPANRGIPHASIPTSSTPIPTSARLWRCRRLRTPFTASLSGDRRLIGCRSSPAHPTGFPRKDHPTESPNSFSSSPIRSPMTKSCRLPLLAVGLPPPFFLMIQQRQWQFRQGHHSRKMRKDKTHFRLNWHLWLIIHSCKLLCGVRKERR